MELEIQVSVNFLMNYLYNKLPRRRVDLFGDELAKKLTQKFDGHWYPEKPQKGSAYRCILIAEQLDPVLVEAAKESGLKVEDVKANLPEKLSLWVDPHEVSYRIGKRMKTYFFLSQRMAKVVLFYIPSDFISFCGVFAILT